MTGKAITVGLGVDGMRKRWRMWQKHNEALCESPVL